MASLNSNNVHIRARRNLRGSERCATMSNPILKVFYFNLF